MDIRNELIAVLNETGIVCESESLEEDIDLRDYITDSIQFIGFVVAIEEKLEIELKDEFLLYDNLQSINGFAKMIEGSI